MATDLLMVFKDMVEAQDKAQELRLGGQNHRFERVRGEKLEALFNERMRALGQDEQRFIIYQLTLDGFLPGICHDYMKYFNGTWGSIMTDFHKVALKVLENIEPGGTPKEVLEKASHAIKHMGVSWDDYHAIMKEARNILKFH